MKRFTFKCSFIQKAGHNLTVIKIQMRIEQVNNIEAMQITSSSGIYKTIYHRGSYLRLFGT